mmetsp:Transcript_3134/g.8649  ORF Transcript_3134/g.8649 Transcript_3134/m.8649 type:complete len:221 (-) Transcript_3134:1369-2031(-)
MMRQIGLVSDKVLVMIGTLVPSFVQSHKSPTPKTVGEIAIFRSLEKQFHDPCLEFAWLVNLEGLSMRQPTHNVGVPTDQGRVQHSSQVLNKCAPQTRPIRFRCFYLGRMVVALLTPRSDAVLGISSFPRFRCRLPRKFGDLFGCPGRIQIGFVSHISPFFHRIDEILPRLVPNQFDDTSHKQTMVPALSVLAGFQANESPMQQTPLKGMNGGFEIAGQDL